MKQAGQIETCGMTDWNTCYERRETPWEKGKPTPVRILVRLLESARDFVVGLARWTTRVPAVAVQGSVCHAGRATARR